MKNQKQSIIEIYRNKKITETFDKEREEHKFQRYKHTVESDFLKNTVNQLNKNKIKVLDVACGTGRMLPEVFSTKKEIEYFGLDTSKEMTKHLLEKAKKLEREKKVKVKIGDASKIPFKEGYFDIVYSLHLLWHLPRNEQEKIIREMLRVCKKEGYIVFDFLNSNFYWEKIKSFFGVKRTEGIHKIDFSEIKKLVNTKKIHIEKINDFPIKNSVLYNFANIINHSRKILPINFYHMIYIRIKK